jgi:hypothetical protein
VRSSIAVASVAGLSVLTWVTSGVMAAGHGLDLTDESFYLVTYRWWDSYQPTFTGTQYLFGPLFEVLSFRIDHLRFVRLLLHVVTSSYLALAVVSWLSHQALLGAGLTPRLAAGLAVVAGGASAYTWLPMSIGYNDVTIMAAVMCSAAVCHAATPSRWVYLSLALTGIILGGAVLAKWTTIGMTTLFVLTVVHLLRRRGPRTLLLAATSLVGGIVVLLAYLRAVVPLEQLFGALRESNAGLASSTNAPSSLVAYYLTSALSLAVPAAAIGLVLGIIWLFLVRRAPVWPGAATALCLCLIPVSAAGVSGRFPAGGPRGESVSLTLWALLAFAAVCVLLGDRETLTRARERAQSVNVVVVCWLLAAPWLHGFGTGNALYLLAISTAAPWMCVLVYAWQLRSTVDGRNSISPLTGVVLAVALLLGWTAATANLVAPYRSDPYAHTRYAAAGIDQLEGLLISEQDAAAFTALRSVTSDRQTKDVLVLDELPGLSLVLEAPPYAEAWTSAVDQARTRSAITAVCAEAGPPSLIVLTRELSSEDLNALRECGIDFYADYRPVPYRDPHIEIDVYAASTS